MTYKTSLDNTAIWITVAVSVLFAIIIGGQFAIIKSAGLASPIFTTTICLIIYFGAFAFRPINYTVDSTNLTVHRLIINARIKKADIKTVEIINSDKIKGAMRTFGVGGLFGYYGKFANSSVGKMTWYATRRNHVVLITTHDDQKFILTPDSPEKFLLEF